MLFLLPLSVLCFEIFPSYINIEVSSQVSQSQKLSDYGLATDTTEGTYAFFYYQPSNLGGSFKILELKSNSQSFSTISVDENSYSSVWGNLDADFSTRGAFLDGKWNVVVLTLRSGTYSELEFTVFYGETEMFFSVLDHKSAFLTGFAIDAYFVIGGSGEAGYISGLRFFENPIDDRSLFVKYGLISDFTVNVGEQFVMKV